MFPYPSGTGLHVGHPLGFIGTDVYSRYQRMAGRNVLYTMGFDAFGLPAEQYAVQTGTAPGGHDRGERRQLPPPAAPAGPEPRPPALDRDHRPGATTAGRSGSSCRSSTSWYDPERRDPTAARPGPADRRAASPSSRPAPATLDDGRPWSRRCRPAEQADVIDAAPPGLRRRGAGQLVPGPGHGRRQRGGHRRRAQRPRQLPGVQAQHAPVDDAHHGLRRPADRRPRPARLDRRDQDDAAQLDRPLARARGSTSTRPAGPITVFTTRPDTLFGATFMVLAPEHPLVADLTTSRAGRRGRRSTARQARSRARTSTARTRTATKTGVFTGSLRHQPGHRRGHPDLDRRLRADGLRHRGDHGRAVRRPARLRVRPRVRPRRSRPIQQPPDEWFAAHGIEPTLDTAPLAGGLRRRRAVRQLAPTRRVDLNGIDVGRRRHRHDQRLAGGRTATARRRSPTSCATGCSAASATGASRSRSSTTTTASPHALPDDDAAADAARHRQLLAAHVRPRRRVLRAGEPARPADDWVERRARPRRRPAGATAARPT